MTEAHWNESTDPKCRVCHCSVEVCDSWSRQPQPCVGFELRKAEARVAELETAIGVMVPTIIRAFLEGLPADAGVDRTAAEATLARVNAAMAKRPRDSVGDNQGDRE